MKYYEVIMFHNVSTGREEKQQSKYTESFKLLLRIFSSQRKVIPFFCGDKKKTSSWLCNS